MFSIVRARSEHARELTVIAHAAKRHWSYPERWIELWHDMLTVTPEYVQQELVFAAMAVTPAVAEPQPIQTDAQHPRVPGILGFYALGQRNCYCTLEHLWVHPAWIGQGVGRALFQDAVLRAATLKAKAVIIESDPNAEGFYRRMGARRVGQTVARLEGSQRLLPLLILDVMADPHGEASNRAGPALASLQRWHAG